MLKTTMSFKSYQKILKGIKRQKTNVVQDSFLVSGMLTLGTMLLLTGLLNTQGLRNVAVSESQNFDLAVAVFAALIGTALTIWWLISFLLALVLARQPQAWVSVSWLVPLIPGSFARLATVLIGLNLTVLPAAQAWSEAEPNPPTVVQVLPAPADPSNPSEKKPPAEQHWYPAAKHLARVEPSTTAWTPRRPAALPGLFIVTPRRTVAADRERVQVVRPGESLWAVAQRVLGPLANDEEIAREWPRWYLANQEAIGPNPNLVLPGQLLQPPQKK